MKPFSESGEKLNPMFKNLNFKIFSGTVYTLIIFKQISDDAISKIWGAALGITPHLTMGLSRNASEFFPDTKLEKGRTILR